MTLKGMLSSRRRPRGRHGPRRAGAADPGAARRLRGWGSRAQLPGADDLREGRSSARPRPLSRLARLVRGGRRPPRDRARALRDGVDRACRRGCARARRTRSAGPCTPTKRSAARAAPASRCWGSPRSRPPKAAPSAPWRSRPRRTRFRRAPAVVVDHPMDPGVVDRIEALKASIPKAELDGLVAKASALSPAAVLAMIAERDDLCLRPVPQPAPRAVRRLPSPFCRSPI